MVDVITILCDVCQYEGAEEKASRHIVTIGSHKPASIDLCERHEKELVTGLADALMSFGRTESGGTFGKAGRPGTPNVCGACGYVAKSKAGLGNHVSQMHKDLSHGHMTQEQLDLTGKILDTDRVACPLCGKHVKPRGLSMHQTVAHRDEAGQAILLDLTDRLPCTECDATAKDYMSLRQHYVRMHPGATGPNDPEGTHQCSICGRVLSAAGMSKHALDRHPKEWDRAKHTVDKFAERIPA